MKIESINIRPPVSILSVLTHIKYEQSYALAEFVDNSIQGFLDNEKKIKSINGENWKLEVKILYYSKQGTIIIEDNAGGINAENYQRAFAAGNIPSERGGLSEFGMGMKSAACWYANNWKVETTAIGEPVLRTVECDVTEVSVNNTEILRVEEDVYAEDKHFTRITLNNLHHRPHGSGQPDIRKKLASIYREFIRNRQLRFYCFNETLSFPNTSILNASFYKDQDGESKLWKIPIDFQLKTGMKTELHVKGFAALRDRGTAMGAGFSLFRRNRLIEENYRPEDIFGLANTAASQRLFGELHFEGVEVNFTKNGFKWEKVEEDNFLKELKYKLESGLILEQAKAPYRKIHVKPDKEVNDETTTDTQPDKEVNDETTTDTQPDKEVNDETTADTQPDISVVPKMEVTIEGETRLINMLQPIVYLHRLPEGGVIKIGITTVTDILNRIGDPQRYFVEDVKCLGVIPCESQDDAKTKETELLNTYGRANETRRQCELVWDEDRVREYIENECEDPRFYIEASRRSRN